MNSSRSNLQKTLDLITFPFRALTLFEDDRFGLSSLATERFDYVAGQVKGYCLDVGCGRHNRFIREFCNNIGKGIDVYKYEGLTDENIVEDITSFPFADHSFQTVTFIANINHIPRSYRDLELKEAHRVCKPGGNIIVTMGNPLAEILVHQVVRIYDRLFNTNYDVDGERGMEEEEDYYLTDREIVSRLEMAGFRKIKKIYFKTQWFLNAMFIGTR